MHEHHEWALLLLPASVAPSIFRDKNRRRIGEIPVTTTGCTAQRTPHLLSLLRCHRGILPAIVARAGTVPALLDQRAEPILRVHVWHHEDPQPVLTL
jgi:hypothetical protein